MTVETAGDQLMAAGPGPKPGQQSSRAAPTRVPWARVFRGEPVQIREVRHWIQGLLPACDALDELLPLVSELCTNAIKHTRSGLPGGWFGVHVMWAQTFIRVTVMDHGSASEPVVKRALLDDMSGAGSVDACEDLGGRGLLIVENMSAAWGTGGNAYGRFVWFDIRWPRLGPLEPESGGNPAELEWLRQRHPEISIWFGRLGKRYFAMLPRTAGNDELVEDSTAIGLDRRLEARRAASCDAPQPGDFFPSTAAPTMPDRSASPEQARPYIRAEPMLRADTS